MLGVGWRLARSPRSGDGGNALRQRAFEQIAYRVSDCLTYLLRLLVVLDCSVFVFECAATARLIRWLAVPGYAPESPLHERSQTR